MNPETSSTSAAEKNSDRGTSEASKFTSATVATAKDAAAKLKEAVSGAAARTKEEIGRLATDKKETAASEIGNYGTALHQTADSLQEKDPNIAWFAHYAADKLEKTAGYMRDRDFPALRHDAEEIARRHPAVFFGGLFLAGLVLGNVVKASRRKVEEHDNDRDYATDRMRSSSGNEMHHPDAEPAAAGI